MISSPKVVFFGNERLATGVSTTAPTLRRLIEAGYEVSAVVANYSPGTSRNARELEIEAVARHHNIPVHLPARLTDIEDELAVCAAPIGILAAYGKMVPQGIIDLFPHGIINLHPSLLPLHRGSIPIEAVILEGATETGISIMEVVRDMDAGPIYAQARLDLSGNESKQELADQLLELGGQLLIDKLPGIMSGTLQPSPQDDNQATYDARLSREQSTIDWNMPAIQIERQIRACLGWPGSRGMFYGRDVVITAAQIGDTTPMELNEDSRLPGTPFKTASGQLAVATGQGELIIDQLTPAGKRRMSGSEFLAGQRL